jgi:hypothetical protein
MHRDRAGSKIVVSSRQLTMPKNLECNFCLFYRRNSHETCVVHPHGPKGNSCIDFRLSAPSKQHRVDCSEELWPEEGSYDKELVIEPKSRWTNEQILDILDNHPLFTGRCPNCDFPYPPGKRVAACWDCPACGWIDDTL